MPSALLALNIHLTRFIRLPTQHCIAQPSVCVLYCNDAMRCPVISTRHFKDSVPIDQLLITAYPGTCCSTIKGLRYVAHAGASILCCHGGALEPSPCPPMAQQAVLLAPREAGLKLDCGFQSQRHFQVCKYVETGDCSPYLQ